MVFSSYEFLFIFLPATLLIVFLVQALAGRAAALGTLALCSLVFYASWRLDHVLVILASLAFNFAVGRTLRTMEDRRRRLPLLALGVAANLGMLGWFKYSGFLSDNLRALGADVPLLQIALPIGISFFTFQQIAFLVDSHRREVQVVRFLPYCLFVLFFPQLIAGPIVHHREMMPQFFRHGVRLRAAMVARGLTILAIGLAKKVLIADQVADYANRAFDAAAIGDTITVLDGWTGTVAYAFQIYFDFSAYSDMAIGLGLLFGIRLPINFDSPYKAENLIDFWRRWHITLSRFLRDYLYVPLGGNRRGELARYRNLLIVMVLGGFWHGANWTFVAWGAMHGLGLALNHLWLGLRGKQQGPRSFLGTALSRLGCFIFVCIAWVFFRAADIHTAFAMLKGMFGFNGIALPATYRSYLGPLAGPAENFGIVFRDINTFGGAQALVVCAVLLLACWYLPNALQWTRYVPPEGREHSHALGPWWRLRWQPALPLAVALSVIFAFAVYLIPTTNEFLYFEF